MRNPQEQSPLITLTTDFGLTDTYVGVMKGVILSLAPSSRLIDLTHAIAPQNILEAGVRLQSAVGYFPEGTLHLVVVDPGVGSERAGILVRTKRHRYVAPDNGVLTLALEQDPPLEAVRITEAANPYLLHPVSATFHGRDVFAPLCARLALGMPLSTFGEPMPPDRLVRLTLPEPVCVARKRGFCRFQITPLYADRFGNIVTSLSRSFRPFPDTAAKPDASADRTLVQVLVDGDSAVPVVRTYTDAAPGALAAYWGSGDFLEIAVRNGSASARLGWETPVRITVSFRNSGQRDSGQRDSR